MSTNNHIQDELNELNSQLPGKNQESPFEVPEGFFEGFAASVMARLRENEPAVSVEDELAGLSPFLAGLPRSMPYLVPENYFSENIQSLPAFTAATEESLVLSFIEKELPYEVPRGYFASFPDTVMEKLNGSARVVPMRKRKWMHMVAAAVVFGIITLSGLTYFKTQTTTKDPVAVEIRKASTEELNAFIKTTDTGLAEDHATAQNSTDVKQLLKDVSDNELAAFIDQLPTDDEEAFDIN